MNVRLFRLSRLALLWAFAFAVALAPWLGGSHVEARPLGAAMMQGEPAFASQDMGAFNDAMGHDCASLADAGGIMPDDLAASGHGQADNPSHKGQMTGCKDMCRMACHVVVILPEVASIPGSFAPVHEVRPVAILETVERDVLVPPPRYAA